MRHELKWFIHLRAQQPRVGDEHPAYAPAGAWLPLPLPLLSVKVYSRFLYVQHTQHDFCDILLSH